MSQLTEEDSIRQADVIKQPSPEVLKSSSDDISEIKNQPEEKDMEKKQIAEETRIAPWKALLQYQKRSRSKEQQISHRAKSDKQQVLNKIRKGQSKAKSKQQQFNELIMSQKNRKVMPEPITELQYMDERKRVGPEIYLPRLEGLSNLREHRYRKKNYNFEDKLSKIKEIKAGDSNINIRGEVIFVWQKHIINEKWAKTEMICAEVWDGSGAIVLTIPSKLAAARLWNLEIGNCVNIQRAQAKEKYPRRLCLLLNEKSLIKHLTKNQLPKEALIEPERLGLSIKQLLSEPVGRICNLVCLIVRKQEKQFFRNSRNADLMIRKVIAYDPIEKCAVTLKLWEEKADIKFFTNGIVYLLRGIEVKEFKEVREYHASKDFNWRILGYSKIGEYLREFYDERDRALGLVPSTLRKMTIKQSISELQKLKQEQNWKNRTASKEDISKQNQISPVDNKKQRNQPPTQPQTEQQKTEEDLKPVSPIKPKQYSPSIVCCWSVSILKITSIELNSQVTIKYTKCPKCNTRIMINYQQQSQCVQCSVINSRTNFYSVKCQVYDGDENYLAELLDQAGEKLFSIENQLMKIGFLDQTNSIFKQRIAKEAVGDTVRAVTVTTRQRIPGNIWVSGHYIIDIVPFETQNSQQTYNETVILEECP